MNDRKHLTRLEVDKLLAATKGARNEARDRFLPLLIFRHGFRVSEACGFKVSQTDAFFVSERRSPLSRKTAWLAIRK